MASQIELEDLVRRLQAEYDAAEARYETLAEGSVLNIEEAKLFRKEVLIPVFNKLQAAKQELADLLAVPSLPDAGTVESVDVRGLDRKPVTSAIDGTVPAAPEIIAEPISLPVIPGYDENAPVGDSNIENYKPTEIFNVGDENVFDPGTTYGGNEENVFTTPPIGIALNKTRSNATKNDTQSSNQKPDWRVRLSLAPKANYLYKNPAGAGILGPLKATDGVIFPYTPAVSVTYSAGYDTSEPVHSNYKVYQYKGSSVDTLTILADFTAQDTTEANYLLAVIHFFRSVTKMFYGQDQNPDNGVPPPLCYLTGFGAYTYDNHPLVITNFTYATPTDVDYIRAGSQTNQPGQNVSQQNSIVNTFVPGNIRTAMSGLQPKVPNFTAQNSLINSEATYVPTKLQLQITCIPIVTRNDISNKFSLKEYATGALLRGSRRAGGGIW